MDLILIQMALGAPVGNLTSYQIFTWSSCTTDICVFSHPTGNLLFILHFSLHILQIQDLTVNSSFVPFVCYVGPQQHLQLLADAGIPCDPRLCHNL